jgi:glycine dehydrogenase subunit 2
VPFPTGEDGTIHAESVARLIDEDTAAIMVTNPNTLGLFERSLPVVARMIHERGGLVYGDGANLNALMGRSRPGDLGVDVMQFNLHKTFTTPHGGGGPGCGPVAMKKSLEPYRPIPVLHENNGILHLDTRRPKSIGRLRSFIGNFGMMVRAYAYIREMGREGLREATDLAVLNANYVRAKLRDVYDVPYDTTCMHEVILSDTRLAKETGVKTLDIAKRLIDYGFHPPTVYFPLLVPGAMMIEPTETESKETLDAFSDAIHLIVAEDPEILHLAPHSTAVSRPDDVQAARKPILKWEPAAS